MRATRRPPRPAPRAAAARRRRGATPPPGAGGTSPRSATAAGGARNEARATGIRRPAGTRRSAAPREADARAEVHQRLAARGRERVAGPLLHAADVRVDRQNRLTPREVADGGRRVRADPRQLGQVGRPALRRDPLCRPVQRERPPVVAQALPLPDHVRGRRRRERRCGRPALEPALEPRRDACCLRLLQHHLGDEDRVRIAGSAPGQVALGPLVPSKQQLVHGPIVGDSRRPS